MTDSNPVGRPRTIKTPKSMDKLVDNYIKICTKTDEPITLTGMIMALGLSSRQSLDEYLSYDGFSDSVKRAKLLIENQYELRMIKGVAPPAGSIFALKNFGWKDKLEVAGSDDEDAVPIGVAIIRRDASKPKDDDGKTD